VALFTASHQYLLNVQWRVMIGATQYLQSPVRGQHAARQLSSLINNLMNVSSG
jgi:hypothetical protein